MARPTKDRAIERLRKALNAIPELRQLRYDSPEFMEWERNTRIAIRSTFGDGSSHIFEFNNIKFSLRELLPGVPGSAVQTTYMQGLDSGTALLKSMIEEVEEFWEDENQITSSSIQRENQQDGEQTLKSSGVQRNDQPTSNKVFVIHGRDEGTKEKVARFLQTLGLEPVILHEQANQGRTIIEKFEDHTDVRFAVVLLTPDDVGSFKDEETNLKPRARQNVIFEFGYFIGKLDRKRVCALTKGEVEIPSDYAGVVYIPLDDFDGWRQKLFQELKTAGFPVDPNRVFSA